MAYLNPIEMEELRLKTERERINAMSSLALQDSDRAELEAGIAPASPAPFSQITPESAEPFRVQPRVQPQTRLQQAQTGFSVQPNINVQQPNLAFLKGEDPQVPIRTGPHTAYLPGGSIEGGDRKLFISPDGTMTNFPTSRDIERFAVKVKQPTTTDLVASLGRSAVPQPIAAPKTKEDWEIYKYEMASRDLDLSTTRLGPKGQKIRISSEEQAAAKAQLIATYDIQAKETQPRLNILAGESSPPTASLLTGPMASTYTNALIRAQFEFDTKIAPKLAEVKSVEDINKLVRGMETYNPKLASQFKVMAERGLARANPVLYAEIERNRLLSAGNEAGMASWFRAEYPDDPRSRLADKELAGIVRKDKGLTDAWISLTGGRRAIIDPVTDAPTAYYASVEATESPLTQSERDRVFDEATGQTVGYEEARLKADINAYRNAVTPVEKDKLGEAQAKLNDLYKRKITERRQAQAAVEVSSAAELATQASGEDKDAVDLATKAMEKFASKEDLPYIHAPRIKTQTPDESWTDVLPADMIGEGVEGVSHIGTSTVVLAKEVARDLTDKLSKGYSDAALRDSVKAVLSRHGKGAVVLFGDNTAQNYVQELVTASQAEFDKQAQASFARIDARKVERMQAAMDKFAKNGVMLLAGDVERRYKAVQAKAGDAQFVMDSEIGQKNGVLDTAKDYLMADISLNWPELKHVARAYLEGNVNVVGVNQVAALLAGNEVKFNTQLLADTAKKIEESPEAMEVKRKVISDYNLKRNLLTVFNEDPLSKEIAFSALDDANGRLEIQRYEAASPADRPQLQLNANKRIAELGKFERESESVINVLKSGLIPIWKVKLGIAEGAYEAGLDEAFTMKTVYENVLPENDEAWEKSYQDLYGKFSPYPELQDRVISEHKIARNIWADKQVAQNSGFKFDTLTLEQQGYITEIRQKNDQEGADLSKAKESFWAKKGFIAQDKLWKKFYDSLDDNKKKALGRGVKDTVAFSIDPNVALLNIILDEEEESVVDEGLKNGLQKQESAKTQETKEVVRKTVDGKMAVYNSDTKQFIRWK